MGWPGQEGRRGALQRGSLRGRDPGFPWEQKSQCPNTEIGCSGHSVRCGAGHAVLGARGRARGDRAVGFRCSGHTTHGLHGMVGRRPSTRALCRLLHGSARTRPKSKSLHDDHWWQASQGQLLDRVPRARVQPGPNTPWVARARRPPWCTHAGSQAQGALRGCCRHSLHPHQTTYGSHHVEFQEGPVATGVSARGTGPGAVRRLLGWLEGWGRARVQGLAPCVGTGPPPSRTPSGGANSSDDHPREGSEGCAQAPPVGEGRVSVHGRPL